MALAIPVGIWARADGLSRLAVVTLVLALAVLPPALGAQATPLVQWLGCLGGLLAGRAVQRTFGNRSRESSFWPNGPEAAQHADLPST